MNHVHHLEPIAMNTLADCVREGVEPDNQVEELAGGIRVCLWLPVVESDDETHWERVIMVPNVEANSTFGLHFVAATTRQTRKIRGVGWLFRWRAAHDATNSLRMPDGSESVPTGGKPELVTLA